MNANEKEFLIIKISDLSYELVLNIGSNNIIIINLDIQEGENTPYFDSIIITYQQQEGNFKSS